VAVTTRKDRPEDRPVGRIIRVRHRRPWWAPHAGGYRYYGPGRHHHAWNRVDKLRARGFEVEVDIAAVGPWRRLADGEVDVEVYGEPER
jgi:hypothetical protein